MHGLAAWMTGLYWIVPTLQTFGKMPLPLAIALTACSPPTSPSSTPPSRGSARGSGGRRRRSGVPATLPALWVALEWLRTYLAGGFPWNLAGYAWVDVPGALPLSAWIGAYGISFLVVLAGVAVAASVAAPALGAAGRRASRAAPAAPARRALEPAAGRRCELREPAGFGQAVRLLQPNIPNLDGLRPGGGGRATTAR